MTVKRFVQVAAVPLAAGLALLVAGCSEDFLNPGGETAVQGRATLDPGVDPAKTPVFDLGVGVTYDVRAASSSPRGVPGTAQAAGVTLAAPYPNPLESGNGTVRVTAEAATTARIEIWSEAPPFPAVIAALKTGALAAGTHTVLWDGSDFGTTDLVPNGLYFVRVTVPADPLEGGEPAVLEQPWIVNRRVLDAITLRTFNAFTDGDGFYQIVDLAVGEAFTRTRADGSVIGPGTLADRLTLFVDDRDYTHFEARIDVPVRSVVTVDLPLIPRAPLAPDPAALARTWTYRPEPGETRHGLER